MKKAMKSFHFLQTFFPIFIKLFHKKYFQDRCTNLHFLVISITKLEFQLPNRTETPVYCTNLDSCTSTWGLTYTIDRFQKIS